MPDSQKQITLAIFSLLVLLLGCIGIYYLTRVGFEGFYGSSNSDSNKTRQNEITVELANEKLEIDNNASIL